MSEPQHQQWAPKLDPSVNFGHIGVIVSVVASAAVVWSNINSSMRDIERIRERYIPIIEGMITTDNLQSERITQLTGVINSMQQNDTKTAELLSKITSDVAVIKSILDQSSQSKVGSHLK